MNLTLELYDEEIHYDEVSKWFDHYGEIPHSSQLPPMGIVCCDEEGPLSALWAYEPQRMGIAFPDWLICRPNASPRRKFKAVLLVADMLFIQLKGRGVSMIRADFLDSRIAHIACKYFDWQDIGVPCHHVIGKI